MATANQFLVSSTKLLEAAGIGTARLDCLVLLEDVLNTNRAQILADPDLLIPLGQLKRLQKLVSRRVRHEPLAYIRNKTEFYGREFFVDTNVLEPRPESETMIELLTSLLNSSDNMSIVDVGTGSGALAITAKLEMPNAAVYALDIDTSCLRIARRNARNLHAELTVMHSDLLDACSDTQLNGAILLCNLPYVPNNFHINQAATYEPKLALYGGADGLDIYRRLFNQIQQRTSKPRFVLTEALPPQHVTLAKIAKGAGFILERAEDFIQIFSMDIGSSGS